MFKAKTSGSVCMFFYTGPTQPLTRMPRLDHKHEKPITSGIIFLFQKNIHTFTYQMKSVIFLPVHVSFHGFSFE